ncbi:MAG: enoyl-CoA hydratase-related protein [Burkholderiaceae bacterium]|nr:enoyl-CoA hydratase-related protein [Burkholderiaceae bacterium]MDO9088711.1 enoyl-CoA hydratase-related protein [Burkholderiaceae bacterium]
MNPPTLETVLLRLDQRGVAYITMNRPQARNALSAAMQSDLLRVIDWIHGQGGLRAAVLTGAGENFCAGADMHWLRGAMQMSRADRIKEGAVLGRVLKGLNELPVPLIGRINGAAYGGGTGMVAVCDIAIGSQHAVCRLSETRLGLIPANIGPFVVARMGEPNARRVFLTARLMPAADALRFGLLSEVVDAADLDAAIERELSDLLECAPGAVAATKKLIQFSHEHDMADSMAYVVNALADAWDTQEAAEGIGAFLGKRRASWNADSPKS